MNYFTFCLQYLLVANTVYPLLRAENNGGGGSEIVVKDKTMKGVKAMEGDNGFCCFFIIATLIPT
jgi:hypothetical protein